MSRRLSPPEPRCHGDDDGDGDGDDDDDGDVGDDDVGDDNVGDDGDDPHKNRHCWYLNTLAPRFFSVE